jgi:periplasmic divalent cation tolerance protein
VAVGVEFVERGMAEKGNYIVVMATADSEEEARRISEVVLKRKLVACVSMVGNVESFFWWKGKVNSSSEFLLVMKSRGELLKEIVAAVKENHSYEVPEVVALRVAGGNPEYLGWIDESVETGRRESRE